ncbi:alpha/beta hydrolase [Gramella jeungdoensis]|uniref:Alpha/beta hydrolase n=1 Tax=Gramella jeungdoensis TaxID=708091 RepID=A0ABT0YYJ7_9FLAO|nr:alpha/beta hydrolase [Gramella jeungdoensis]MCM8568548.1 alpha/beta hydrolase [Gramella jeungdoensis]
MKNLKFLTFFFLQFLIINPTVAKTTENIDESFYIPVQESELFVRVSGNLNKPLIIYLHGGPGGFSTLEHELYKNNLEQDYLIAYFDQRGCGQSKKETDTYRLNIENYIKDLEKVIVVLSKKYGKEKVNLMGESWGGTYGLLYLLKDQSKVSTMITNGGVANAPYAYYNLIQKERVLTNKLLKATTDPDQIKKYKHIIKELERIEKSDFDHFFNDMNLIKHTFPELLNFNPYRVKPQNGPPSKEVLEDCNIDMETLLSFFPKGEYVNKAFRNQSSYNNLNILDKISDIKIPVLVIQGEKDYSVGINQAKLMYKALNKEYSENKHLEIIKNAGHSTTGEQPGITIPIIKQFLDNYNK